MCVGNDYALHIVCIPAPIDFALSLILFDVIDVMCINLAY